MIPQQKPSYGRYVGFFCALLLLLGGAYALFTALSPLWLTATDLDPNGNVGKKITGNMTAAADNRLYIPKLNVEVPVRSGDASALEDGAWWRTPTDGNPKDGGNFVIAAHRFQLGWTPQETTRKSPLYAVDKLQTGDQIVADYEGQRYVYEVTKIHRVAPNTAEIEAPTTDTRLTLYSCTRGGSSDGREVIIATRQS